jgi:hypothetical protein
LEQDIASPEETEEIFYREKLSDILRWINDIKETEKKFEMTKVSSVVAGFLILCHPEIIGVTKYSRPVEVNAENVRDILRFELARRSIRDGTTTGIKTADYKQLLKSLSSDQTLFIDKQTISLEQLKKTGLTDISANFMDWVVKEGMRPSHRTGVTTPRGEKSEPNYILPIDEMLFTNYLFQTNGKDIEGYCELLDRIAQFEVNASVKDLKRLVDLYGIIHPAVTRAFKDLEQRIKSETAVEDPGIVALHIRNELKQFEKNREESLRSAQEIQNQAKKTLSQLYDLKYSVDLENEKSDQKDSQGPVEEQTKVTTNELAEEEDKAEKLTQEKVSETCVVSVPNSNEKKAPREKTKEKKTKKATKQAVQTDLLLKE